MVRPVTADPLRNIFARFLPRGWVDMNGLPLRGLPKGDTEESPIRIGDLNLVIAETTAEIEQARNTAINTANQYTTDLLAARERKAAIRAATLEPVPLTSKPGIVINTLPDGTTVASVLNQSYGLFGNPGTEAGIYTQTATGLVLRPDMDTAGELQPNSIVSVMEGIYANQTWLLSNDTAPDPATDRQNWINLTPQAVQAGDGLLYRADTNSHNITSPGGTIDILADGVDVGAAYTQERRTELETARTELQNGINTVDGRVTAVTGRVGTMSTGLNDLFYNPVLANGATDPRVGVPITREERDNSVIYTIPIPTTWNNTQLFAPQAYGFNINTGEGVFLPMPVKVVVNGRRALQLSFAPTENIADGSLQIHLMKTEVLNFM